MLMLALSDAVGVAAISMLGTIALALIARHGQKQAEKREAAQKAELESLSEVALMTLKRGNSLLETQLAEKAKLARDVADMKAAHGENTAEDEAVAVAAEKLLQEHRDQEAKLDADHEKKRTS